MSEKSETTSLNLWTIASIAIVAYCLGNVVHEGLGHGGACLLVGGKPEVLNAIYFSCNVDHLPTSSGRIVSAGGSVVNLIVACFVLLLMRARERYSDSVQYFLWLFLAVNILTAFGYFLFSGVAGVGDWAKVFEGLASPVLIRGTLIVVGAFLYFYVAPKLLMPTFRKFVTDTQPLNAQVNRLMRFPYLVGGATFVVAGLLNPESLMLVLISAVAASFGGTSLLAWYPITQHSVSGSSSSFVLPKSKPWMITAAMTLVIFVGVLGRGIQF